MASVDEREARYAQTILRATWPNGDRIEGVTRRTADLIAPGVVAAADAELAELRASIAGMEVERNALRILLAEVLAKAEAARDVLTSPAEANG